MPDESRVQGNHGSEQVTFARDLGLFDATMIGVGAMIGAGIFVLTGIAAGEAGPASILAFALNGLVTLLTAFAYAELASAIPRAGGGYSFVRMAFPGVVGFVSGWMLWFAYTVACSLYALGFAGYFWEFFVKYTPWLTDLIFSLVDPHRAILIVTLLIGSFFVWLNVRGAEVTGKTENVLTVSKICVLGIFVFFGLLRVFDEPGRAADAFLPFFPAGLGGVLVAMGLTFIAFEGYDLIATVAEEIKDPEKNIPRATFISLSLTVVMYLMILFVSLAAIESGDLAPWKYLGQFKETAIVRAAEGFMPAIGVAVIVAGGLLSTMSALNATVMAASRVAFSMGRDMWLPSLISRIHVKRRTPHIAVIVTGMILMAMALTLPIEAVGSAASLIFLLTFALVNLSVIVLRRKYPEIPRRYRVPLYPVVPIAGLGLNVFLALYQFKFQPVAWFVTAGWVGVGALLYYSVSRKAAESLEPQVLMPQRPSLREEVSPSVLVALHNPANVDILLKLAGAISTHHGLGVTATSVVEVPRQLPIHEGMRLAHHKESLLNQARSQALKQNVKLDTDIVIAHQAADGILAAVQQHKAHTLVMGWKGYTNTRDRLFGEVADRIIRQVTCDLVLVKVGKKHELENCLLPTAGGPNARLAATILSAIAVDYGMSVTVGHVIPEGASAEQRRAGEQAIEDTAELLDESVDYRTTVIKSATVAGGIAKASREYDLVVIGAAKEPYFRKILFGEIPEKVARYSPASVMVVKKYEGVIKSVLKRYLG
jgi:amino acid transporter/nucleotide-binding universal stress UspA family protein